MQRVISRVHRIVTASSAGDAPPADDPSPPASNATPTVAGAPAQPPPSTAEAAIISPVNPPSSSSTAASSASAVSAATQKEITLAVERLQYATLLGERKKAVASLQELARTLATDEKRTTPAHVALGLAAIPAVLHALVSDPRDTELMEAMLELLQEFVSTSSATAAAMLKPPPPPTASPAHGSLRSAAAAAASASVSGTQLCLQLLQDPSPWIRGPTITLVKCMQEAQQKEFAASVLECKEGLRRLLEVVEDKREHIRDAALQVLVKMTEREKSVQQFLAFEDGFGRLFQIMEVEGLREGSSVVSDCLQIVNNMVRDNLMNQTLFRDLPFLATHLPQLLSLPSPSHRHEEAAQEEGVAPSALKSTQKKRTMKLVLQLVRFLVAGLHEGVPDAKLDELAQREKTRKVQEIGQIQSHITRQRELMGAIGDIVCCGNEELTDLQLQALDLIQLLCSANGGNQIILVNLQTLTSRQSLLSELIKLDIAEDETPVGAAATNLLDALFTKNESAKMAIFQHLNAPPPIDDENELETHEPPLPAGRVLLDVLVTNAEIIATRSSKKSLRSNTILAWKACHRFASLVADSAYCKELALRIPSHFEKQDTQAVSGDLFITRCLRLLSDSTTSSSSSSPSSSVFQVRIALLTMLIQWCVGCTNAVRELVGSVTNLSILVGVLSPTQDDQAITTSASKDEQAQLRGLTAILLGCCLEYLVPSVDTSKDAGKTAPPSKLDQGSSVGTSLTRQKLLDLIGNKVGLERFTNALIQFQQSPHVIACARTASKQQRARLLLPHLALFPTGADSEQGEDGYLFPLYDRSFTVLCRELAEKIQQRVLSIFTSADEDEAMGVGGTSGPSAASAYQDLIRMQDKQIQELQRQVSDLTALAESAEPRALVNSHVASEHLGNDDATVIIAEHNDELAKVRFSHARERSELEHKVAALTEQSAALESRFQGLSRAFEELEAEHSSCAKKFGGERFEHSAPHASSSPTDAIGRVVADLERERSERRLLKDKLREESQKRVEAEQKIARDNHVWEMSKLQLHQEMEELRMSLAEKEEQLIEQSDMIEVFRQGQNSAKRSATQLKVELEQAQQQIESLRAASGITTTSVTTDRDSKHEAAAKEMYQLWEKERVKVRGAKAELEKVREDSAAILLQNQSLQAKLSKAERDLSTEKQTLTTKDTDPAENSSPSANEKELQEAVSEVAQLKQERASLIKTLDALRVEKEEQIVRLQETVKEQLADIEQLRILFEDMETAAKEAAHRVAQKDEAIEDLKTRASDLEEKARGQKSKAKATITELEDEIARMFFERTEAQRKSKAALKQAEHEIARMFLEKVELEKQIALLGGAVVQKEDDASSMGSITVSEQQAVEKASLESDSAQEADPAEVDEATAMDDLFVLLSSLEIQCTVFRECLADAKGDQAVAAAVNLSRERGALVV